MTISNIKMMVIGMSIILSALDSTAKDFGKMGNVFGIKEEGFIAMIQRKLRNIDMKEQQHKMQQITKERIEEPEAVAGIISTTEPRIFTFDPTYIVSEDIKLPNGKILYTTGTKVNPLDHMDFDRKLFFIDGKDLNQVSWLKKEIENAAKEKSLKEIRIILVSGKPLELSEELATEVYFDQFGELTKKFGIRQVPATIIQENSTKILRIEEILIEKNN